MGITRKTLSILTLGMIDWRSDKERAAAYARQTRDAARALVREQRHQSWPATRTR